MTLELLKAKRDSYKREMDELRESARKSATIINEENANLTQMNARINALGGALQDCEHWIKAAELANAVSQPTPPAYSEPVKN